MRSSNLFSLLFASVAISRAVGAGTDDSTQFKRRHLRHNSERRAQTTTTTEPYTFVQVGEPGACVDSQGNLYDTFVDTYANTTNISAEMCGDICTSDPNFDESGFVGFESNRFYNQPEGKNLCRCLYESETSGTGFPQSTTTPLLGSAVAHLCHRVLGKTSTFEPALDTFEPVEGTGYCLDSENRNYAGSEFQGTNLSNAACAYICTTYDPNYSAQEFRGIDIYRGGSGFQTCYCNYDTGTTGVQFDGENHGTGPIARTNGSRNRECLRKLEPTP